MSDATYVGVTPNFAGRLSNWSSYCGVNGLVKKPTDCSNQTPSTNKETITGFNQNSEKSRENLLDTNKIDNINGRCEGLSWEEKARLFEYIRCRNLLQLNAFLE